MQIIIVSDRLKAARTIAIMPRHVVLAAVALVGIVIATAAAFSWLSLQLRLPVVQDVIVALQQREARETQEFLRNNLQLMATRLGELQAQVWRLDTLGQRVSALTSGHREIPKDETRLAQGGPFIAAPLSADALQQEIDRLSWVVDSKTDELAGIESKLLEKRVRDRVLPTTLPVQEAQIGSGFGQRVDPFTGIRAVHEGIDFNAPTGTPVYAAAGGMVVSAEFHPDFGNMVDIDHGEGLVTRYAHLSKTLVKPGQMTRRGDPVGAVGSTGRATGSHLHFEVRMLGAPQNPAHFLKSNEAYAQLKKR